MTYSEDWKLLAARIRGLNSAANLHAQFLAVRSTDSFGRAKMLRDQCASILVAISKVRDQHRGTLPRYALDAIEKFVAAIQPQMREEGGTAELRQELTWSALVQLAAFESELSFLLADNQQRVRSLTERAFLHLQRLITVDGEVKQKWQRAFRDGEVECEKLGALQLLHHGIWAFKVNAAGERTDLIYQNRIGEGEIESGAAEGLVLTEWKLVTAENAATVSGDAKRQAARYAAGALAGAELTSWRYIIAVSANHVNLPADLADGGIIYRHINIAVDPRSPSRA